MALFYARSFSSAFPFCNLFSALDWASYILRSLSVFSANRLATYSPTIRHPCIKQICEFDEVLSVSDQIHTFGNLFFFGVVYVGKTKIFTFYFGIDLSHLRKTLSGCGCIVHRCIFFRNLYVSVIVSIFKSWHSDMVFWVSCILLWNPIWYITMLSRYSITGLARHWLCYALETVYLPGYWRPSKFTCWTTTRNGTIQIHPKIYAFSNQYSDWSTTFVYRELMRYVNGNTIFSRYAARIAGILKYRSIYGQVTQSEY